MLGDEGILAGDPAADLPLKPFDYLVIKEVPLWAAQEEVELGGEVKFPGRYPIHRGETLRSVMERAGGLTDLAFIDGAVFLRLELKEREKKQLETLATRMESDIAQFSLMAALPVTMLSPVGLPDFGDMLAPSRMKLSQNVMLTFPLGITSKSFVTAEIGKAKLAIDSTGFNAGGVFTFKGEF